MLREPPLVEIAMTASLRTRLRDQLPQKDHFDADVVGHGGDVGRFERQRHRRNGPVTLRRIDAVERPIVGIGGRSAVAEQDQLAALLDAIAERLSGCTDRVRLFGRNLLAQFGIVLHLEPNGLRDLGRARRPSACFWRPRNG